ncbi:uncharacterized protein F4822DRAFT_430532 [Hypoxylon trugodes]|uniref:uncharacterized protein n=1 Tax=Hypoxylon trugodes TaxID=326681 RepID=UPI00219BD7C5|nr:uncharacterized protein F4822DRAFT_430532 [Hypoxylon trugodes]KAI1387787.1 hypothetical protein F4822DRAFT_430532 [Hypoxylon trugodes]
MRFAPRKPPRRSRRISEELEDEIREYVFDQGDDHESFNEDPQLIIGNTHTGCYGLYYVLVEGTLFTFHHANMGYDTVCNCLVKGEPGDETIQIPDYLDHHRIWLITSGPPRMEPKLAAMVAMKLFLGLKVPQQCRMKQLETIEEFDLGDGMEGQEGGSEGEKRKEERD